MARGPVTQHVKAASMSGMGSSSHCLTCAFTAKDKIVTRFREELFSPNMRQRTTQWQDSNPKRRQPTVSVPSLPRHAFQDLYTVPACIYLNYVH